MSKATRIIFTAAMREHDEIVTRAGRKALAIYTVCFVSCAVIMSASMLLSCLIQLVQ